MKKKSNEEWKILVEEYNKSGLSMTAFANNNDIKPSTFIYRVKSFNHVEVKSPKLVKLSTIQIVDIKPIQIAINKVKLEIPGDMVTEKIARLVSAIREVI